MTTWSEPAVLWRAGPWSLELRGDELADIAFDGVVLLRSIRAVVRDHDWGTVPLRVQSATTTDTTLELAVRTADPTSSIAGGVRVEQRGDGLAVTCDLTALDVVDTNRTGLVVLHAAALAGTALVVTHPGGDERTRFPTAVSPLQPAADVVGLGWRHGGLDVQLDLDGDVFEMEDQRNWTDASYKTYSRPLALPFPYRLNSGDHVRQGVRIGVRRAAAGTFVRPAAARIALAPTGGGFPSIALGAATAPDPPPAPSPGPVLVELDLAAPNWRAALERARRSATALDVRLVVDPARPAALRDAVLALSGPQIARITAFEAVGPQRHVSTAETIGGLRTALESAGVRALVVGGVRSHFTELNREHAHVPPDLAGIVFAVTPLFHSDTTAQLVESLAIQRLVAEQAVATARGVPVHVGPVTLRPRFNDVATSPQPLPTRGDLRDGYGAQLIDADDPRQRAPELAAWTVASAAALTVSGVASLTYFEQWGPRGIRSSGGEPYPVAAAIVALRALENRAALAGPSPDGLLWATGSAGAAGESVLVANLHADAREVRIETPSGERGVRVPGLAFTAC